MNFKFLKWSNELNHNDKHKLEKFLFIALLLFVYHEYKLLSDLFEFMKN